MIAVQVEPLSVLYSHPITVPIASAPNVNVPPLVPLQTVSLAVNVPPTVVGETVTTS